MKNTFSKVIYTVFLLQLSVIGFAQSEREFSKKYTEARESFDNGNYEMAMIQFSPLLAEVEDNTYLNNARYFNSLSAFHLGKFSQAQQNLLKITYSSEDWKQREEAYYLLSNVAFEQTDYKRGLEYSIKCESKKIAEDVNNLKIHYLLKIEQVHLLKILYQEFPEDKELAEVLAYKLSAQKILAPDEKMLLNFLMQDFKFETKNIEKHLEYKAKESFKDEYHVALLFPLELSHHKTLTPYRKQQFILDYYQGMKWFADSMKSDSFNIVFHAYDTKKDSLEYANILAKPELKQMDLLVGPIFPKFSKQVEEFCNTNQIKSFNPFSEHDYLIEDSISHSYLFRSSQRTSGEQIANFILKNDSIIYKTAVIILEKDSPDTNALKGFAEKFISGGGKILDTIVIKKKENILSNISSIKKLSNLGSIYCVSSKQFAATNTNSLYVINTLETPLFAPAEWLDLKEFSIENFNSVPTYFYNTEFINRSADSTTNFFNSYFKTYEMNPSKYSYFGVEMAHFLNKTLTKYGNQFTNSDLKEIEGIYYPNHNFTSEYRCNQFLPIFKMEDYKLIPQNFSTQQSIQQNDSNK